MVMQSKTTVKHRGSKANLTCLSTFSGVLDFFFEQISHNTGVFFVTVRMKRGKINMNWIFGNSSHNFLNGCCCI